MTYLFDWLAWKWNAWRLRKPCRAGRHDMTGPELTAAGWSVYRCTRCGYRFRSDELVRSSALPIGRALTDKPGTFPDRWRTAECPGRSLDGTSWRCTEWHAPGVLYRHAPGTFPDPGPCPSEHSSLNDD